MLHAIKEFFRSPTNLELLQEAREEQRICLLEARAQVRFHEDACLGLERMIQQELTLKAQDVRN